MLQDIRTRVELLPITITWKWVEGHQDDFQYADLDWWALMNIKMDTLAKDFLEDCTTMTPPREHKPQQLLYEKWALEVRGVKQSSITRYSLYVTLFGPRTLEFWNKHDKLSKNPEDICWEESKLAIRRLPFGLRRWQGKFLTNCSGFALTLQTWKYQDSSACPVCDAPDEDRNHLLQCPDPRATHQFKKSMAPVPALLKSLDTSPALSEAILTILKRYRAKQTINPQTFHATDGLRDAIREQAKIGWHNFILGRWTYKWKIVQKAHYDRIGSRKTPKRWLTAILHKLSRICWDLWQFRNKVLHAPAGTLAVAQHYRLNQDIEEQFALGTADLRRPDYPLIRLWTVASLHACDIITKKQWLESIRLAREEYEAPEDNTTKENHLVRDMRRWLFPDEDSI